MFLLCAIVTQFVFNHYWSKLQCCFQTKTLKEATHQINRLPEG